MSASWSPMISCLLSLFLCADVVPAERPADTRDAALQPPTINVSPGPEYADTTRRFQGIPGIERAENGRLWAVWYAGGANEESEGPGNYVVLVTSADEGQTWSGPKLVIDPVGEVRAYDPCLWRDPQGRLWLFWAQSYNWWDGRSGVWCITTEESSEQTPRWSSPRRLANGIMMNKPTVLSTGEWLLPAAVWETPATDRTAPEFRHHLGQESGANVHVSRDRGVSWDLLGQVHVPNRAFDEHMVVERRDGSLWMLVRAAYGIGESFSEDRGKTWTPGRRSTIPHVNARFFVRRLSSGNLLLVTHEPPDGKSRSHLVAHLSADDGLTWRGGLMIDERRGVSYPDGVESRDGTISVIYDYSRTGEKQILMATFTEQDVVSGQWSSAAARRRVLVNQATFVAASDQTWYERKTSWHGYEQFHFQIAGRPAYLVTPKQAAAGRPWVWRARFPDYHAEMDITLLSKGYHVAYVDVAGMFGSPKAVSIGDQFYDFLTTRHDLARKMCLEGVSRGGLFVYNFAASNPDKVACIYCDTPVCDFKSWPGGKGTGLGSDQDWQQCLRAYGLTA